MVSAVMEKEIGLFFRGLSKSTLELSPINSSSLRSCNDHFALGWVERSSQVSSSGSYPEVATTMSLVAL